jgi:nitric oxide synthase-interacting protein
MNDLLAQRQEIKRLEKERDEARKRIAEDEERSLKEMREKDLRDFELVSMGLENKGGNGKKRKAGEEEALEKFKSREVEVEGKRKRVFELGEEGMARLAGEERERLRRELKSEKVRDISLHFNVLLEQDSSELTVFAFQESSKSALPSFWVPSLTPNTDANEIAANKSVKLTPICPGSTDECRHSYSLKSLVDVKFTEEKASDGTVSRVCPSCKKNLSNGLKAMRMWCST